MGHTMIKRKPAKKCPWCRKIVKPVKGCWFQVYCTGGKCRAAYNRDLIKRGKELAKKAPRAAAP